MEQISRRTYSDQTKVWRRTRAGSLLSLWTAYRVYIIPGLEADLITNLSVRVALRDTKVSATFLRICCFGRPFSSFKWPRSRSPAQPFTQQPWSICQQSRSPSITAVVSPSSGSEEISEKMRGRSSRRVQDRGNVLRPHTWTIVKLVFARRWCSGGRFRMTVFFWRQAALFGVLVMPVSRS